MSYTTELSNIKNISEALVVISPRVKLGTWESMGGDIYRTPFNLGYVTKVFIETIGDFSDEGEVTSPVSDGSYGYDEEYIYVNSSISPVGLYSLATYEMNLSTTQFTFHRKPRDTASKVIDWNPVVTNIPVFTQANSDVLFGYTPIRSSNLTCKNDNGFFYKHCYDSSFNNAEIFIYHSPTRDLISSNIKTIFTGYVSGVSISGEDINFEVSDSLLLLEKNIFNGSLKDFRSLDFLNLSFRINIEDYSKKIRRVFGIVDGLKPLNYDYGYPATTSNNRYWICKETCPVLSDNGHLDLIIDHTASNTATETYTTTTPKVNVGDWLKFTHSVGGDKYGKVTAVDYVLKKITHASISRTISSGDTIYRPSVASVKVEDSNGTVYDLELGAHWNEFLETGDLANGTGFQLVNNFEAAVGFSVSPFDPGSHKIFARVYGPSTLPTGITVNTSNYGGVHSNGASIIYELILDAGISQSFIDLTSFNSAISNSYDVGFAIPSTENGEIPTYKEIINKIQQSCFFNIQANDYNNFSCIGISTPGLLGAGVEVDDTDFYNVSYSHDYKDIYTHFNAAYNEQEVFADNDELQGSPKKSEVNYDAVYLHSKGYFPYTIDTLLYVEDQAEDYVAKLSSILGDRRGKLTVSLPINYIEKQIGDDITISRDALPGEEYLFGSSKQKTFKIVGISKTLTGIILTLDDNRGIEENSGSW